MQSQIDNVSNTLLQTFKSTTQINNSLYTQNHPKKLYSEEVKEKKRKKRGKDYGKEADIELLHSKKKGKDVFTIESEVVSLPTKIIAPSNPRTREMIRKLDESKRRRHLNAEEEFYLTIERLQSSIKGFFDSIVSEV